MTSAWILIDILLALAIICVAWILLMSAEAFRSIVLFITFGVLLSIVWVRLQAPDLALVEAAIGAGLTGALFLDTLGRMEQRERQRERRDHTHD